MGEEHPGKGCSADAPGPGNARLVYRIEGLD